MNQIKSCRKNRGYVALMMVLIVSAVSVSVVGRLLLLSVINARGTITTYESRQAVELANLCVEDALLRLYNDPTYVGSQNIIEGNGECDSLVSGELPYIDITATGTVSNIVRNVSVSLDAVSPYIVISEWKEI